jgi:caa(3)-type oxidase subunit IV
LPHDKKLGVLHVADTQHHAEHHGNVFKIYMVVAVVLSVATATSFLFNWLARPVADGGAEVIGRFVAFALILSVAIVKATLVGMYFMHLKWDWKLLYFLIIPVFIMGTMMMVVLLPDIFFGPNHEMAEGYEISAKVQP